MLTAISHKVNEFKAELARRYFLDFVTYTKPNYQVNWHHSHLSHKLDDFLNRKIKRLMVFMPPQHGKLISHDTPVLTTDGWKTHGELKPGNFVVGRNGQPVQVLAVSPEDQADYKVTFLDGTEIFCHANHEWVVYDRELGRERTLETKKLASLKLYSGVDRKRGNRARFQVDTNVPVHLPEKDLPIHPYVLGVWLGDGSTAKNCITHHLNDKPVIDKIKSIGYCKSNVSIHNKTGIHTTYFTDLYADLVKSNLLHRKKRIPDTYLAGSYQQRLELLAGLLDSDGYIYQKNGRACFSNINLDLINDVKKLVISLGCRVTVSSFDPVESSSGIKGKNIVYQLTFNPYFDIPTALPRKRLNKKNPSRRKRGIYSITKVDNPKIGQCIQVEGGVYLVGENLIPTHNSELVSRRFPAYALGKDPNTKIAVASYSGALATGFSRDTQRIMESPEFISSFPGTLIPGIPESKELGGNYVRNSYMFEIVRKEGFLKSVGVGGSLTGTPVDIAIIDDPVKDFEAANSDVNRESIKNWYRSVLETRLHNDSIVLLTMTRWHEDDLAGWLLKEEPEKWEVVTFPAVREDMKNPDDPRNLGEALWPNRHNLEKLESSQKSDKIWSALFQQRPTKAGGNIWKRWFIEIDDDKFPKPEQMEKYGTDWDLAYTEKEENSASAYVTSGIIGGKMYIDNLGWTHKEFPDLVKFMYVNPPPHYIENKASGKSAKQTLSNKGIPAFEVPVSSDKVARANTVTPYAESGLIAIRKSLAAKLYDDPDQNILSFPNGVQNDLADALAQSIQRHFGKKSLWIV